MSGQGKYHTEMRQKMDQLENWNKVWMKREILFQLISTRMTANARSR
jgi:hypothetical protein